MIMVKRGQSVEVTNDYYTIEGVAMKDWDDEGEEPLIVLENEDWTALKIRVDLATSLIVDGTEIINLL